MFTYHFRDSIFLIIQMSSTIFLFSFKLLANTNVKGKLTVCPAVLLFICCLRSKYILFPFPHVHVTQESFLEKPRLSKLDLLSAVNCSTYKTKSHAVFAFDISARRKLAFVHEKNSLTDNIKKINEPCRFDYKRCSKNLDRF